MLMKIPGFDIPRNMDNEQSKIVASVIVAQREFEIAQAKRNALNLRLERIMDRRSEALKQYFEFCQ